MSGRESSNGRHPCPCCGCLTLSEPPPGTFEVCPVCFWEDDASQFTDATQEGGANRVSLAQAKRNFATFGASEGTSREQVRPPLPEEAPAKPR